jgi:predicted nucleotidyltransferase
MQLSDKQRAAIVAWAEKTPEIQAVILYGSWYIGTAKPETDVDLALVMTREGFSGQQRVLNNFDSWEADLRADVGLPIHLVSLDPLLGSEVQAYVAKGSIELWRRE